MDTPEAERSARVHAALAYRFGPSDTTRPEQAEALGWTLSNTKALNKLLHGDEALYREKVDQLIAVTGVPRWFFTHGFAPPVETGETDLRERMEALEQRLSATTPAETLEDVAADSTRRRPGKRSSPATSRAGRRPKGQAS